MKITVICPTYNHEKFIEKAMAGFIRQVVSFHFEVWVVDDASTDKTQAIIKKYAAEYPSIIKPILREKNLGPKLSINDVYLKVKSEYIVFCEGDDYWCCDDFLERAVIFLDRHPECVMYTANTLCLDWALDEASYAVNPKTPSQWYTIGDNITYVHTTTRVFRYSPHMLRGDTASFIYCLTLGKSYYENRVVSVYNCTGEGVWSSLSKKQAEQKNIELAYALYKLFDYKYENFFCKYMLIGKKKLWRRLKLFFPVHLFWKLYFIAHGYSMNGIVEWRDEIGMQK